MFDCLLLSVFSPERDEAFLAYFNQLVDEAERRAAVRAQVRAQFAVRRSFE